MIWCVSHRADADCLPLADRHYNRQMICDFCKCECDPACECVQISDAGVECEACSAVRCADAMADDYGYPRDVFEYIAMKEMRNGL